jgi:hypothetical protein
MPVEAHNVTLCNPPEDTGRFCDDYARALVGFGTASCGFKHRIIARPLKL